MQAQQVKDVMTPNPTCLSPSATVMSAALLMREKNIGGVVVCDDQGSTLGFVTDRDIVIRCVALGQDVKRVTIGEVCTEDPIALDPEDTVQSAVKRMASEAVRRLVVEREGKPVGIVSLGDLAVERDPQSALSSISEATPQA